LILKKGERTRRKGGRAHAGDVPVTDRGNKKVDVRRRLNTVRRVNTGLEKGAWAQLGRSGEAGVKSEK